MKLRQMAVVVVAVVVIALGLLQFRSGLSELFGGLGYGADADVKSAAQKAATAADAFATLAKDSASSGSVPRGSDLSAAPLLDAVFHVGVLRSKASLGEPDLASLSDWSAAGNKVGLIYLLAGTGTGDVSQAGSDPKVAARARPTP